MAKKKDSNLVQDALIPDEMSPLSLLDFNSSCAKIKQAAVDFRRAVNHKMQLETKDAYLDKFHQIDPYTEAVYDTDALAQHIIDCAEVINRLLTYPKNARRAVLYDNLHDSLATFEESAPDYPDPDDDAEETDSGEAVDPNTEAVYDTDALAQHIIDCAEVINRLLTYPKNARRAVLYDNLHDSLATFEESAPDYPDPDDDAEETDSGEAVDPNTGEIK